MHAPEEEHVGRTVFAFDRDSTVDVCPPIDSDRAAVPLDWVAYLAHHTDHVVYATGNQKLVQEASIPGIHEIREAHPRTSVAEDAAFEYLVSEPDRRTRVQLLRNLYPNAEQYVVVDDVDLTDLAGWDHYTAWDFVPAAEAGEVVPELPPAESALEPVRTSVVDPP